MSPERGEENVLFHNLVKPTSNLLSEEVHKISSKGYTRLMIFIAKTWGGIAIWTFTIIYVVLFYSFK